MRSPQKNTRDEGLSLAYEILKVNVQTNRFVDLRAEGGFFLAYRIK